MYTPISRKYRPQDFDSITGQEHIIRTLRNAIRSNKTTGAYLFCGSRGVGKTSTARVFSKALNCEKGPTEKPCNRCASCRDITNGASLDVLEIDGASNRGINEIRDLRENVKLKPISGKYKIYIIDEVHMLTSEAFNALLKTLEEPPPHVKFLFATTRPYKILPTILSRCQRYDFKMINTGDMITLLKAISGKEGFTVDDDGLRLIAKNAGGSLRDAEIMLDQIVSYKKGAIRAQDVSDMLGLLQNDTLYEISRAISDGKGTELLESINTLINSGRDALFITRMLVEHFRDMMVMRSCGESSAHLILNTEDMKELKALSARFSMEELFYVIYTLSNAMDSISKTALGRIPLETALLKLCRKERLVPISELLERVKGIRALAAGGSHQPLIVENTANRSVTPPTERTPLRGDVPSDEKPATEEGDISKGRELDFQRLKGIWPEIVRAIRLRKVSAGTYLEEGYLQGLKEDKIIVGFPKNNSLHKEALEANQNLSVVLQVIREFTERDLKIIFVESGQINEKPPEDSQFLTPEKNDAAPVSRKIEPIIKSAIDKFGGKIEKRYYMKEDS